MADTSTGYGNNDQTTASPGFSPSDLINNIIPDPSTATVADVIQSINTYKAGVQAAQPQVQAAIDQQKSLSDSTAEVLSQAGADASTVSYANSADEMAKQARIAKTAAILGVDVNANNEQYTALAESANQAQKDKDDALAVIKQKQSIGLLDNPAQYLYNQLTINSDIAKHNTANAQLQSAHDRIVQLNQEAQGTFQTEAALAVGTTQAQADAAARLAAAGAITKANDSRIQGLQYGIAGVQLANNTNKEVYQAMYSGFGAEKMEQGMVVQNQQLALAKQAAQEHIREFNINDTYRQAQMQDREDAESVGQSYLDSINRGRVARGATPLDDTTAKQTLALFKTKGILSNTMQFDYANGEAMGVKGGQQQIIATSPTQYAQAISQNIPIKTTPQQQPAVDLLHSVVGEVSSPNRNDPSSLKFSQDYAAARANKDANAMSSIFNARVQSKFDMAASNIDPNSSSNPYAIASINSLATQSPTVANTAFYTKVLAGRATNGEQFTDPNKVFNAGIDALANKTITLPEFLDMSTVYQVGVNNARAQRNVQGLMGVTPRLGYNTSINGTVIDITKPDALARAAITALRSKVHNDALPNNIDYVPNN